VIVIGEVNIGGMLYVGVGVYWFVKLVIGMFVFSDCVGG